MPADSPPSAERGSGTVLMVSVVAAIALAIAAVLVVAHVAVQATRAASAADLAALAAADAARGLASGDPCTVAADVAQRNDAVLVSCARSGSGGSIVDVVTSIRLVGEWAPWPGRGPPGLEATGASRAGPPPTPWSPREGDH
ncbi:Rv3654c family TadE-like protein [Zhihengliuella sp.]|uniref:Rv3654c family TadE-like protein n=1 Tax=Zhihengliuella sp. TaxID=1954483 RepID=UPI002810D65C|nr:Rv3654c family TadE-like protein [Zhihengliuella sp.]